MQLIHSYFVLYNAIYVHFVTKEWINYIQHHQSSNGLAERANSELKASGEREETLQIDLCTVLGQAL